VLLDPLRWRRPRRIFVCAHGDLFHDNVPDEWLDRVFAVMALAPQHTFQVLTKRPERMRAYVLAQVHGSRHVTDHVDRWQNAGLIPKEVDPFRWWIGSPDRPIALPNVWLGVSVEDQQRADERIPILLATPAAVRWLSCEPLLGPVELDRWLKIHKHWKSKDSLPSAPWHPPYPKHWYEPQALVLLGYKRPIQWIVAGGESGPGARPMHPDWARSLRDQCAAAAVPFLFKQWGEFAPGDHGKSKSDDCRFLGVNGSNLGCDRQAWSQMSDFTMVQRVGKKAAGRMLDGVQHDGFPG
jgi:protein gp37